MTLNIGTVLLAIAAVSFYTLAVTLVMLRWKPVNTAKMANNGTNLFPAWIALVLHAVFLQRLIAANGIVMGFSTSLTLFTWCTTLVSMIIALYTRLVFLAAITLLLSVLSILIALALPGPVGISEPLSFELITHIVLSISAYSLLSIAALIAILLGVQDYQLHHHQQGIILRLLPPLQTLEKQMFRLIEAGFLLLSFAVISGFLFTEDLFNHKIVFSCIAWLVFLTLLLGRHYAGWRGQTAIRWTLSGLTALMLAFFGTKIVLEFLLSG